MPLVFSYSDNLFHIAAFRWVAAGFLGLVFSGTCLAGGDPQYIALCTTCAGEQDFAQAAVREVPDPPPGDGLARVYPVYVVNPRRGQVEFFSVHVQRNEGGISPFSTSNYSFGLTKTAHPGAGDPTIKAALLDAALIAEAFAGQLNDSIRADEISDVSSAIDLVGPYDSPAGLYRNQLQADINDHYNSVWSRLVVNFSDMTSRLASKIFGSDGVFRVDGFLTIEFPDGTVIKARIDEILEATDSNDSFSFELTIQQHTARLPDGTVVPQNAGQFAGFNWSDGPTGPSLAQRLALLAAIYGLDIGDASDPLDCTMTCDAEGHCKLNCSF